MKTSTQITKEVLDDMKKASILTGKLTQIQLNTLIKLPLIVIDNISSVSMNYDIVLNPEEQRPSRVVYRLKANDKKKIVVTEASLQQLSKLVSSLLWPGIMISIKQGKKTLGKIDESGQPSVGKKAISA